MTRIYIVLSIVLLLTFSTSCGNKKCKDNNQVGIEQSDSTSDILKNKVEEIPGIGAVEFNAPPVL